MPDTNSLFNSQSNANQAPEVTGEDALAQLVGEGNKYASVEEMAKAFVHGQHHIQTLEQETATLRESTQAAKSIEDVLAAIKGTTAQEQAPAQDPAQLPASELSVADQIAAALAERDNQAKQQSAEQNRQSVVETLNKTYGAQAAQVYAEVGGELGLNLDELAGKSPAAVLKLVAQARPEQQPQHNSLPSSSVNTGHNQGTGGVLNQKAIKALYDSGKIKLNQKHELENKQLTLLGAAAFYQ